MRSEQTSNRNLNLDTDFRDRLRVLKDLIVILVKFVDPYQNGIRICIMGSVPIKTKPVDSDCVHQHEHILCL